MRHSFRMFRNKFFRNRFEYLPHLLFSDVAQVKYSQSDFTQRPLPLREGI